MCLAEHGREGLTARPHSTAGGARAAGLTADEGGPKVDLAGHVAAAELVGVHPPAQPARSGSNRGTWQEPQNDLKAKLPSSN